LIRISDLRFHYPSGDFQLAVPSLRITAGEKVAIIGPSGSGKTTLLNLVAGLLTPAAGSVRIDDFEISGQHDAARRDFRISKLGFIFQDFGLIDYLQVKDNILHPYRISRALKANADVRGRARWLAEQMGIGNKLNRYPADLSHGERQRVAICRALLPGPKLILADEATGNLDPKNKLHILDLLFENVDRHKATLLAVTHDQELLPHFDRVINFNDFIQAEVG
jgi:putative ABC transport system ATP-binding protein